MSGSTMWLILALAAGPAFQDRDLQDAPHVIFMDPIPEAEAGAAAAFVQVTDSERLARLETWMDNEPADWARQLYADAYRIAGAGPGEPIVYVALIPGRNHADAGFVLRTPDGEEQHPITPYLKLGEDEWRFASTFLHETGHAVFGLLLRGKGLEARPMASIPHSTAALTDRTTAFNEGYGIHLETLLAHISDDPRMVSRYRHEQARFGSWPGFASEYYRQSADVMTYAQSFARYQEVRDNTYAFASSFTGPDYLRVQLEKGRDFSTLRRPDQLLQSEGFYASFFFGMLMRDGDVPDRETLRERQRRVLVALAEILPAHSDDPETPWLLRFVRAYRDRFPGETAARADRRADVLDVLLDLSHGVFVDPNAAGLWRDHYKAALILDIAGRARPAIEEARARWRESVLSDMDLLESRIGTQIECSVETVSVHLVAFGDPLPLYFDANTVQPGILRMVPGLKEDVLDRWITERDRAPFDDARDLAARARFDESVQAVMSCGAG